LGWITDAHICAALGAGLEFQRLDFSRFDVPTSHQARRVVDGDGAAERSTREPGDGAIASCRECAREEQENLAAVVVIGGFAWYFFSGDKTSPDPGEPSGNVIAEVEGNRQESTEDSTENSGQKQRASQGDCQADRW